MRCARCDSGHGATRGFVLTMQVNGLGGQEFPRCLIINGHMNCGSRSPPKRKRSFPMLAVMPTLKLAGAPEKQAMIPWRGTGALSRRRSPAGQAGAHPCSTPYSVEQAALIPGPRGAGQASPVCVARGKNATLVLARLSCPPALGALLAPFESRSRGAFLWSFRPVVRLGGRFDGGRRLNLRSW
jgi:hypothetical protein